MTVGVAVWIVVLSATGAAGRFVGVIESLFLLAPLVVVPLGLSLPAVSRRWGHSVIFRLVARVQPLASALLAGSFLVPKGTYALLAVPWLLMCSLLASVGLVEVVAGRTRHAEERSLAAGFAFLPVGVAAAVLSRAGLTPLGFQEPLVLLTAVHFHYAGFATAFWAGMAGQVMARSGRVARTGYRLATAGALVAPVLLAVGFIVSPALKVTSALLLGVSLIVLSALVLSHLLDIRPMSARLCLAVSSLSILPGVLLGSVYAVGDFVRVTQIDIPTMALSHGVLNGLGFVLCGLIGWCLAKTAPAGDPGPLNPLQRADG